MTVVETGVIDVVGRDVFSPARGAVLSRVQVEDGDARCGVSGVGDALAAVIPLPMMGERIEAATESGVVAGVWVQRVTGPTSHRDELNGFVTALLLSLGEEPGSGRLRTVRCQAGEWDARRTVVAQPGFAEREALALLVAEMGARTDEKIRHEQWREQVIERAHEEADREGWCSKFDRVLEELGMPGRVRDYLVEVRVSFTVYVSVSASDADDAMERVERDDVIDAINDYDIEPEDWEVEGADQD